MRMTLSERNIPATIGITMGDPNGIGPEVIVKALSIAAVRGSGCFVVYGIHDVLVEAANRLGVEVFWDCVPSDHRLKTCATPDPEATGEAEVCVDRLEACPTALGSVIVVDHSEFSSAELIHPTSRGPSEIGGRASLAFLDGALQSAMKPIGDPERIDAIVTAPISKTSWKLAGETRYPGHTELLADRTGAKEYAMMFVGPRLRTVLATIHVPLMDVRNVLTLESIGTSIELAHRACREQFGIDQPRIAVCGLNPHASEGGLFGEEEAQLITPAIELARHRGIDASGPYPADTVFNEALDGRRFDVVVAMYHDQGTIPIKLLSRDEAVNVTIGLPIVRTSPDHGTAFDIAGTGTANPGSMKAAIGLAVEMAGEIGDG